MEDDDENVYRRNRKYVNADLKIKNSNLNCESLNNNSDVCDEPSTCTDTFDDI